VGDRAQNGPNATGAALPFWVHQVVELLLGALLLLEGARSGQHTAVLVGFGGALLLLSLMSDGALGVWPWIGRRVHRIVDFGFAAVLAVSPLVLALDRVLPIVVLEAAAAGLVWLAVSTKWAGARRRRAAPTALRPAPLPPPDTPAAPVSSVSSSMARQLGAVLGSARRDGPRRLGRAIGRGRRPPTSP
jgi:hypothetical protein